jgi:ABC-type lipoprotein export system ATPase subunit
MVHGRLTPSLAPTFAALPLLACENLHKTYTLGRVIVPVLRGVSMSVDRGEFLGILGSSGSGKSTLLHLLGGLDRPDTKPKASLIYRGMAQEGEDLAGMSSSRLDAYRSRDVGIVFQFYHLLPELTVLENVLIAAMISRGVRYSAESAASVERAETLLEAVGLSHRRRHRPVELSGGERQRVALARALINQPKLLLADEPTGNLDQTTGAQILDLLASLRQQLGLTLIVVTHDAQTARRADRTLTMRLGVVGDSANLADSPLSG